MCMMRTFLICTNLQELSVFQAIWNDNIDTTQHRTIEYEREASGGKAKQENSKYSEKTGPSATSSATNPMI
jgi:hypothetical protein